MFPNYVIKLTHEEQDFYLEWSTREAAPVTNGMSLSELRNYWVEEYSRQGLAILLSKGIIEVKEKGTSCFRHSCVEETIENNRAGVNKENLTKQEIIKMYVIEKILPER